MFDPAEVDQNRATLSMFPMMQMTRRGLPEDAFGRLYSIDKLIIDLTGSIGIRDLKTCEV